MTRLERTIKGIESEQEWTPEGWVSMWIFPTLFKNIIIDKNVPANTIYPTTLKP